MSMPDSAGNSLFLSDIIGWYKGQMLDKRRLPNVPLVIINGDGSAE
ncbi:MAG: hypothetical protein ACJ8AH_11390 [Stellaceae bacterium]|jgi:hypothetical protein